MHAIVRLAFVAGLAATVTAGATVGALAQLARQQAAREPARLDLRSGVSVVIPPEPAPAVALGSCWEVGELTLSPCDLPTASFTACTFRGDWRGLSLQGVNLWECDLRGAVLRNPLGARNGPDAYPSADLTGCTYDRFTRWPEGFDPRRAGARLEE